MRSTISVVRRKQFILFLVACVAFLPLSGLAKDTPSAADEVIITRYFQKHTWKVFEACQVVGVVEGDKEVPVKREKRKDVFVSRVKPGAQNLVLEVMTSTDSIFKQFGGVRFHLEARLREGTSCEVKLLRNGDHVEIWICEAGTDTAVSDRVSFEIEHPLIKPIVIIPIG
jgi:hypothetical protein